ncbi:RagB/SusD family nutrient uptake outer membrane protein [Pedobacter immunditicola]|uniref:RagB/SusD family nutrient uptake outer membrane protein n=1 Tax=Pedobacter immunditicola TaxID=3133440 RepID=UPI0030A6E848
MNLRVITCLVISLVLCVAGCQRTFIPSSNTDPLAIDPQFQKMGIENSISLAYHSLTSPAANWNFVELNSSDTYRDKDTFHVLNSQIAIGQKKLACLEGIGHVNDAIRLMNRFKVDEDDLARLQMAELRFLRGHFSFELQRIADVTTFMEQSQVRQSWSQIEADFKAAATSLPDSGSRQPGMPGRFAAWAYLAKTYIYQKKWTEAIKAADEVIHKGGYSLMADFADVFLPENENNPEIVFAIQYVDEEADVGHFYVIRYPDVLLWRAEAAIELADYETGRQLINQVSRRARDGRKNQKAGLVASYKIEEYSTLFDCYECAIDVLNDERRLY